MTKHCESCICDDPKHLDNFTRRCWRLADALGVKGDLPPDVRVRLPEAPSRYALRFTGWKHSYESTRVCGQFLASLYPVPFAEWNREEHKAPKLLYVNTIGPVQLGLIGRFAILEPILPVARGYFRGDVFDISNSPAIEDIETMMEWSDSALSRYLGAHLLVLRLGVEKAASA